MSKKKWLCGWCDRVQDRLAGYMGEEVCPDCNSNMINPYRKEKGDRLIGTDGAYGKLLVREESE